MICNILLPAFSMFDGVKYQPLMYSKKRIEKFDKLINKNEKFECYSNLEKS